MADEIASKSPQATRLAKRALAEAVLSRVSQARASEDAAWRDAALSDDYREGLRAFGEKRRPVWAGAERPN
jgi:2-(1,2-epoxy-1,2-dihydrophenyl)acetyl-CoA isomerase